MVGTIASLITAYFLVMSLGSAVPFQASLAAILITTPCILLFALLITPAISWNAIQRTEQKVFPRAYELLFKDYLFFLFIFEIVAFLLYSFDVVFTAREPGIALSELVVWVIFFGVSLDLMIYFVRRLLSYSHHQFLLKRLDKEVVRLVRQDNDAEAFQWLETAIEVAARAINREHIHVAKDALRSIQGMCEHFVRTASKVGALRPLSQKGPSLLDEVSTLSAYVCRRLEWLSMLALQNSVDPVDEDIASTLGKMSLFFGRYNPEIAKMPLLFVEKMARSALQYDRDDLAVQYCFTLSEVAKGLLAISREKNESRRDAIFAALQHLESVVTAIFQKNKDTNAALLMQPFAEVAALLATEAFEGVVEHEQVMSELRRILQSFGALDQVLSKLQRPKATT